MVLGMMMSPSGQYKVVGQSWREGRPMAIPAVLSEAVHLLTRQKECRLLSTGSLLRLKEHHPWKPFDTLGNNAIWSRTM